MKFLTAIVAVGGWALWSAQPAASAPTDNAEPILEREQITGDWVGTRPFLSDHGVEITGGYTAEIWGNTAGGIKSGAVYTGLMNLGLEVDLEKAVGWQGASLSTTWLWLSGRDASEDLVGNLLTISNIAGFNTFRMFELWFQQNLLDDKISIRFGQIAADSEFLISDYSGLFINGTFGWPAVAFLNLPEGGPGFPMGTLGGRLAVHPAYWFTFQTAVFQGNVFAQDVNRHGFRWSLDAQTGCTLMGEAQVRWNHRDNEPGPPGQLKAGAWFQTGEYADPLADSTGSGNSGYYLILDQMVFREPASGVEPGAQSGKENAGGKDFKAPVALEKTDQGLGWFGRIGFTPASRNFINFYFDAGITYKGLIPTRDNDTVGLAVGYAQLSSGAQNSLAGDGGNPAGSEMVLELTYQAQITPSLVVQPDLQYIINPGGTNGLNNALVIGARASVAF